MRAFIWLFCLVAILFSLEIKDEVSFVYKNDKVQIYLNLDENSTKGHIFYDNKEHVFNAENFNGSEVNFIYDDGEKININFVYDGLIFEKRGDLQSLKLYKKFNFLALNSIFDNGSNVKFKYSKNLLFQGDKKTIENELKSSYKEELDYFLEFVSDLQDDFPFTYETEKKWEFITLMIILMFLKTFFIIIMVVLTVCIHLFMRHFTEVKKLRLTKF